MARMVVIVAEKEEFREEVNQLFGALEIDVFVSDHQGAKEVFLREKPSEIIIFDCNSNFSEGERTYEIAKEIFGNKTKILKKKRRAIN